MDEEALVKFIVDPTQTSLLPVIVVTVGNAFTVTVAVVEF